MKRLSNYRLAAVACALALAATGAVAEQTVGVQDGASTTDAVATARVNVRVLVPKIVILRVGDAANTVPQIDFTYGITGFAAPQASASYTGAIPPVLASTTTGTLGASNAGVVVVGAWTNMAGTTLTCALGALGGSSAFFADPTTGGVPGTAGITWAVGGATPLPHPGTNNNLTDCNGTNSNTLTARTAYNGTYTYASNLVATDLNPGTYGLTVTYTATAP
jgi:hypothetical protein